jgi:hypothetical protein
MRLTPLGIIIMSSRRSAFPLLIAISLLAAACSSPSASVSPSPSTIQATVSAEASASEPTSPSDEASPSESAAPEPSDDELGAFSCDLPVDNSGTAAHAQITDVRVGSHPDYDRIVFEFVAEGGADAIPPFSIEASEPPFLQDGSGMPIEVSGDEFLTIHLFGGTKVSPTGGITYDGPTDFTEEMPRLDQLTESGDFEAVSTWIAGMHASDGCYRVTTLDSPSRLVIDLEH